jgi:hypothetical protein
MGGQRGGKGRADKVRSTRHKQHLGTTTGNVEPRQQLGRGGGGLRGRSHDDRGGSSK